MKVEQDPNLTPGTQGATADPTRPDSGYEQRREQGRATRRAIPRGSHAHWAPAPDRPDPSTDASTMRCRVPGRHTLAD